MVVNSAHTSARAAGVVFGMVRPRMAAMWHCQVVEGFIDPIFEDVATSFDGPTTLCQDLTIFNVTADAISARQARTDPVAPTVQGPSQTARQLDTPHSIPGWWQEAAIDRQAAES